jgi:glycosyltransferase involved in cell wall biosynthesis
MHVLVISPYRYVGNDSPSGSFIATQVLALNNSGINMGVIAPSPITFRNIGIKLFFKIIFSKILQSEEDNGIFIVRWNGFFWPTSRLSFISRYYWIIIGLIEFDFYRRNKGYPDLIHCHDAIYAGELGLWIKRLYGIKFLVTEHSSNLFERPTDNYLLKRKSRVFKSASEVLFVSNASGEFHKNKNIVKDYTRVPNLLSPKLILYRQTKEIYSLKEIRNFMHVSNFAPIKNIDLLVEAFVLLRNIYNDVELTLVGYGETWFQIRDKVKIHNAESYIHLVGNKFEYDLYDLYLENDALVLPSTYETFGVVLIEALALGKPVCAFNIGGPSEIVNSCNGVFISRIDVDCILESLIALKIKFTNFNPKKFSELAVQEYYHGAIRDLLRIYKRQVN